MNLDEARARFQAIQAAADRDNLRYTPITLPNGSMTKLQLAQLASDNAAFGGDVQASLGLCWEHAARGLEALTEVPPAPAPSPAPGPADYVLSGFAGVCHWDGDVRATDWYGAPHGTWFGLPVAGTLTLIQTPGPMGAPLLTGRYAVDAGQQWNGYEWTGWTFLCTHILNSAKLGHHARWEKCMQLGNSGIEMLPGNPSHVHFFADAPGGASITPDGKGDVAADDVLRALGYTVQIVPAIPSPQDYLNGRANAGRFI